MYFSKEELSFHELIWNANGPCSVCLLRLILECSYQSINILWSVCLHIYKPLLSLLEWRTWWRILPQSQFKSTGMSIVLKTIRLNITSKRAYDAINMLASSMLIHFKITLMIWINNDNKDRKKFKKLSWQSSRFQIWYLKRKLLICGEERASPFQLLLALRLCFLSVGTQTGGVQRGKLRKRKKDESGGGWGGGWGTAVGVHFLWSLKNVRCERRRADSLSRDI